MKKSFFFSVMNGPNAKSKILRAAEDRYRVLIQL